MSQPACVLLAGASGLVGGRVLARLLADPAGPQVLAPVRRPLGRSHARLLEQVGDPADPDQGARLLTRMGALSRPPQAYVCCLGTTLKAAGSQEAFLAVDRDLVLQLAALAVQAGARQAILVSSVGASAQSGNFYLRVKGETERALAELGFARVDCLRPGLLLGPRQGSRPAEALGQAVAPYFNPLLRGALSRYRAIAVDDVAAAAVALLGAAPEGHFVHEYTQLRALASTAG